MPHELPAVICSLLHSSAEVPLDKLTEAAEEASHGRLGRQWNTDEHCPCPTPVGAALQAAHKDLGKVNFSAPECENTVATRPFRSRSLSQSYSHL